MQIKRLAGVAVTVTLIASGAATATTVTHRGAGNVRVSRGSVRMIPKRSHAKPGSRVVLMLLNGTDRTISYGECFSLERSVQDRWVQLPMLPCPYVLYIQQGHSERVLDLYLPKTLSADRYRLTLQYQARDDRARVRTHLTVT